jgi:CheY-like chemotaxis protein
MAVDKPIVVLLVEDEALVRMFADEVLTVDGGLNVIATANAIEAMTILRMRSDVRVLFTDVNMPGSMDGLDLAHQVHADYPHVAIIVTSGRGLAEPLPPGARFLMKPYAAENLIPTIHEMVGAPKTIVVKRPKASPDKLPAAAVMPTPVNLNGPRMGNGTTGGLAQPLSEPDE